MKYKTAVEYRLLKQLTSLGVFFLWWFLFGVVFPIIGGLFFGNDRGISVDISFLLIIFSIIISFIGIGTDFKFFIQNGLSRYNIFFANLTSTIITSVIMTILFFILPKITIKGFDLSIGMISRDFYNNDQLLMNLFLLFVTIFFFTSLGLLVGTFNNVFSGLNKILIVLIIGSVPLIIANLIQLGGPTLSIQITKIVRTLFGYYQQSLTLLVLTFLMYVILFILTKYHEILYKNV